MKQLGIGIIGTGNIADTGHAPAISAIKQTNLVGVLSRDESNGQDFLQKHGAESGTVHTSLESFVADPRIDLAIICSPDRLHAEQARVCLIVGKHVLIEKPMTVNIDDAAELVELTEANKLILAIGFHLRSHNGHIALYEQVVKQGVIGNLKHIRVIWAFPVQDNTNWRAKKELAKWWSLSAVGSHCIDLARWFAGDMNDWKQFSSVINTDTWKGPHDETSIIAGQLSTGPTVEIVSSVLFGPYDRIELFGDKGHAICEGTLGRNGGGEIWLNNKPMVFEPVSPFTSQLQNVVDSIESKTAAHADGRIGLRSVKDLLLAYDV